MANAPPYLPCITGYGAKDTDGERGRESVSIQIARAENMLLHTDGDDTSPNAP